MVYKEISIYPPLPVEFNAGFDSRTNSEIEIIFYLELHLKLNSEIEFQILSTLKKTNYIEIRYQLCNVINSVL